MRDDPNTGSMYGTQPPWQASSTRRPPTDDDFPRPRAICMSETRAPAEWERIDNVKIIDPDGWRRDGKDFTDPIDYQEWRERKFVSTCGPLVYGQRAEQRPQMRECVTHHVCDCIGADRDRLRARVAELEAAMRDHDDCRICVAVLDGAAPDQTKMAYPPHDREVGCCRRCRAEWEADNRHLPASRLLARMMSLCPDCGDKRCPKASDHRSPCGAAPDQEDDRGR